MCSRAARGINAYSSQKCNERNCRGARDANECFSRGSKPVTHQHVIAAAAANAEDADASPAQTNTARVIRTREHPIQRESDLHPVMHSLLREMDFSCIFYATHDGRCPDATAVV